MLLLVIIAKPPVRVLMTRRKHPDFLDDWRMFQGVPQGMGCAAPGDVFARIIAAPVRAGYVPGKHDPALAYWSSSQRSRVSWPRC